MSADLNALLARASNEIEGAAPLLDGGRLGVVRSAARRRRIARHTAESFAGVGAVGVLGVGLWFGLGQQAPEPVVPIETPTVTPSPSDTTPTPTPTPSETPTPTGPPTRAEQIDDATVIERINAPRTGEVWQTPTLVEDVPELRSTEGQPAPAYLVGTRGEASIYLQAWEFYGEWSVEALYEVDADGARVIACPSARSTDACVSEERFVPRPGFVRDVDTFYDSLTVPESIELGNGFTVTTKNTVGSPAFPTLFRYFGDAAPFASDDYEQRVLRDLGQMAVVARVLPSLLPGMTTLTYGYTTPLGTFVVLDARDVPAGDFEAIAWDDGIVRAHADSPDDEQDWSVTTFAPGGRQCEWSSYSQEDEHVAADWRPAGTTTDGNRVYVPVEGGTPLSRSVRAWHEENSWGVNEEYEPVYGAEAGYSFLTDAAFLDANALFALQGPSGEWLLGMRADAGSTVYECV